MSSGQAPLFVIAAAVAALIMPTAGNTHGDAVGETVTVAAEKAIPNLPGKRLVSLVVDYSPGEVRLASSCPLSIHLRLRPRGRDPESGR
jgi:hypothetical protein